MRVGGRNPRVGYRVGRSPREPREVVTGTTAVTGGTEEERPTFAHEFLGAFHTMPAGIGRSDTVQVVDGAGTVEFRSPGHYSVLDFGAIGDGVTEDTAVIQTAITTAATDNKALFVPPGYTFLCRKLSIPSNSYIYGVPGKSKLKLIGNTADAQDDRYGMVLDGTAAAITNVTLRDLVIFGANEDTVTSTNVVNIAIVLIGSASHTDLTIEGCEFYWFRSRVLFQGNVGTITRLRFVRNRVHDIGTTVMNLHVPGSPPPVTGPDQVTVSALTPGTCIDALVAENIFHDIGTTGNHWTIYCSRNVKHLTVVDNLTYNTIGGFKFQNANQEYVIVNNNQFRNIIARQAVILAGGPGPMVCNGNSIVFAAGNTSPAFQIADTTSVTCNGNVVDMGGNASDGAIFNINNVTGATISGNVAENGDVTAGGAIQLFSNTGETTQDVVIVGNVFRDCASIGFFITGGAGTLRNCSIIGNTVKAPRGVVFRDGDDISIIDNTFECTGKTMEFDVADSLRAVVRGNRGSGTGIYYSGTNHIIEDNALEAQPQPSVTDSGSKVRRNSLPATAAWVSVTTGTTPSVLTSDRFLLAHTASTTVTNFTDGREGETKTFLATTANVTLQHTAGTMELRGDANYTMAIGDIITLDRYNSIWYESSRTNVDNHNLFSSRHPDVDAADVPAGGDILTYDGAASKWKASPPGVGNNGALLGSWGENDIDVNWTATYADMKRLDHPTFTAINKVMPRAGTVTGFAVQASATLGTGVSITCEAYKNGTAQSVSVNIINGSDAGYNTTGFSFAAGDRILVKGRLDSGTPTGMDVDAQIYGYFS